MKKRLLFFAMTTIFASNLLASDLSNFLQAVAKAAQPTPTGPVGTQTPTPKLVWVQIVNATVGPCKVDGSKWHGSGKVSPKVSKGMATALLGSNPYSATLALLADPIMADMSLSMPSPYGWVDVAVNDAFQNNLQRCFYNPCGTSMKHTLTPIFTGIEYQNVPLDDGTRFKVTLMDQHLLASDGPIGVAEINSKDLKKALDAQTIYQIPVADQTQNQLLFVGIEVREKK